MGLSAVCLPVSAVVAPAPYSKLVAFGDSLTDTGNFYALTASLPANFPVPLPQAADYWNGRFSNGKVAVDILAEGLGVGLENYAYGGAKSGAGGQVPGTGLLSQVSQFTQVLAGAHTTADAGALYFVWGGGNDLRDITPATFFSTINSTINNLTSVVGDLYNLGARSFLLPNLPDLGLTPEARSGGAATMGGATFASETFNAGLKTAYDTLLGSLVGAHFVEFDVMASQRALTANPANFGLSNVEDACFTGYVAVAGTHCAAPAGFLYWDKVHPTATTHQILGSQMLAAVPEPQSMLMLAAGLLGLLAAVRRRSV